MRRAAAGRSQITSFELLGREITEVLVFEKKRKEKKREEKEKGNEGKEAKGGQTKRKKVE